MPQIQEYQQQVAGQEPVGGTSPNIELAGAAGKGLEQVGQAVSEGTDLIERRAAQQETANVYADFADKREQWTTKLNQQIQDGTLDVEKFSEDYDNDTSKLGDNLSTSQAKNFFERSNSRVRSHLLQLATAGKAQIASNEAKGQWVEAMNVNSSTIEADPTQFGDIHDHGVEAVDELIKSGGLPEKYRDKALEQMGVQFSHAALRGLADQNPDHAREMLKGGAFDQYLNSDQKHQALGEINRVENAKEIDKKRTDKAVQDAKDAAADKWMNDNYAGIQSGSVSTKSVLQAQRSGVIDWQQAEQMNHLIDQSAKADVKTNPRVKNELIQRIVDPDNTSPIDDPQDLMPYVGKGLSIADFNQMNALLNKTPEQKAIHAGEKSLFDSAKKTIRFKDDLNGGYGALGEKNLARFGADYSLAKQKIKDAGGNVGDLVDPNSPLYFGNKLRQYQTPMADRYTHIAQDRTDKGLGLKPSGSNPDPTPVPGARKPGESIQDWKARTEYKGGM